MIPRWISWRIISSTDDQSYVPWVRLDYAPRDHEPQGVDAATGHHVEVAGARQGAVLGDDPVLQLACPGRRRERQERGRDKDRDPCGASLQR